MHENLLKVIGQNLRILRKSQGLTIRDLSLKSGISFSTLSAIENERSTNISTRILVNLASALQTDFLTIVTPINSVDKYIVPIDEFDEEDCINTLAQAEIKKTYYPPTMRYHKISSMLELAIVLPLLDLGSIYDTSLRIMGAAIDYEDYISELFDRLWDSVPDSPAKQCVQKELDSILAIRNGALDIEEYYSDKTHEELDSLRITLQNKLSYAKMLREVLTHNCLF